MKAGENTAEIDALRRAGQIGVRLETVGDAREWTASQIEQAIGKAHPGESAQLRSNLLRFTVEMHPGDLVVLPNTPDREVWLAVVTGPYEFGENPTVANYHHTRTVEWLGWLDRSAPWLQNKLKYIDTPAKLVELRDPNWWFEQIAAIDVPRDRPDRPRRPAPAPSATKRAPSNRPPVVPRPKPPEMVLCAGPCQLQWRASALVGGLCPDCRGD